MQTNKDGTNVKSGFFSETCRETIWHKSLPLTLGLKSRGTSGLSLVGNNNHNYSFMTR
jgi:hypothetical protein